MKRMIAGMILLCIGASHAPPQTASFDDAQKGDEVKKLAFLEQELGKLVWDKEKNPAGYVKAWFYAADPAQKAKAEAAMREEYKKEGREKFYEKESAEIFKGLESPACRIQPFYRESAPMAQRKCQGYLPVGDVFGLRDEAEFKSTLEDYILPYLKSREEGLVFKDGDIEQELNPAIPVVRDIAHASLLNMYARSGQ